MLFSLVSRNSPKLGVVLPFVGYRMVPFAKVVLKEAFPVGWWLSQDGYLFTSHCIAQSGSGFRYELFSRICVGME